MSDLYLVHSSGGREKKNHKYIYKRKMPNGKWRYFYNQPKHNPLFAPNSFISGLSLDEQEMKNLVNRANSRSAVGKDTSDLERAMVGRMNMANEKLGGKSGLFPDNRFTSVPIDERPKRKR